MRKYKFIPIWAGTAALIILGCNIVTNSIRQETVRGSGRMMTEERVVEGVLRVEMASIGDLAIEIGGEERLTIEAEENLLPYIESNVSGNKLTLETRRGISIDPNEPVRYKLTVAALEEITVSGLGDVQAPHLEAGRFRVRIPGSGNVTIASLSADELDMQINGLGDVTIEAGQVDEQALDINGSGNYNARELECARADVSISGAGSATLWVREMLRVRISGAGNVRYFGDPSVSQEISGVGSAIKIDE